jgi:hypothetical protein
MCACTETDVRESASDCTLASGEGLSSRGETSHPICVESPVSSSVEHPVYLAYCLSRLCDRDPLRDSNLQLLTSAYLPPCVICGEPKIKFIMYVCMYVYIYIYIYIHIIYLRTTFLPSPYFHRTRTSI